MVFILLNLNSSWNMMFQTPNMVIMVIAATRMYRILTEYGSSDFVQDTPTFRLPTTTKSNSTCPIRLNRMKVTTHEHSEQFSDMYIGKGGQVCDEPQSPVVDGDVDAARRDEEHDGNGTCTSN